MRMKTAQVGQLLIGLLLSCCISAETNGQNKKADKTIQTITQLSIPNGVDLALTDKKYLRIYQKLDRQTIVDLTKSPEPGVRCLSFMILVAINDPEVRAIFRQHLNDTTRVMVYFGNSDMVSQEQVNVFMLDQLHPVGSVSDYRFSKEEWSKYTQQLTGRLIILN